MYFWNFEPTVEELLADPVAHLVMARDGLQAEFIWGCVRAAKRRLNAFKVVRSPFIESTQLPVAALNSSGTPTASQAQAKEYPPPLLRRRPLVR